MDAKNNIPGNDDNELDPRFSKAGNPFKTAPDYFEDFTSKLNNRIGDLDEISALAPILSGIPKYNPFEVPKHYFDELPSMVQDKTAAYNTPSFIDLIMLFMRPRVFVPVLSIALIAFAGIRYMNNTAQLPSKQMAEEVSVEDQLYNIDESVIIDELTADAKLDNESASDNENTIENYLIDNNIDESNLNNEL